VAYLCRSSRASYCSSRSSVEDLLDAAPYPELVETSGTSDLFVCYHIQNDPPELISNHLAPGFWFWDTPTVCGKGCTAPQERGSLPPEERLGCLPIASNP
jgi:hypothetical protein